MSEPNVASKLNEVQGLESGRSLPAFPGSKAKECEDSNGKMSARQEVEIQVRDKISPAPQTQTQNLGLAKDGLPSGFLGNPLTEDKETNQQTEPGLCRILDVSQGGPPTSHIDIQAAVLKIGFKVSCWVTAISATGIISVLVGYIGNHTRLTHKPLFKVCMLSLCGSFVSGAALFLLSIIRPNTPRLIPTIKVITWMSVGLMTLTVGLGTCILLRMS